MTQWVMKKLAKTRDAKVSRPVLEPYSHSNEFAGDE